jgi:O-antigen/teichoic acid export membrane protein
MSKELKHFFGLLLLKGIRAVVNFLFIALLARLLGPNGLGEWTMVIAAGTLLHSIFLNWMHSPTIRFGREEWQKKKVITTTWSARLPYLLAGFIIVASLVVLDPVQWMERYFHISGNLTPAVFLAFLGLWLSMETQSFLQLRQAILRLALLPVFIDSPPMLMLIVILAVGTGGLSEYMLITGLLALSVIFWGMVFFWEARKLRVLWVRPRIEVVRKTFRYAWPLIPGFLLGYVCGWGNQLLVRYFFTTHEVGLFQAAYQFMILLVGVTAPLGTILLPRLIDREMLSSNAAKEFLTAAGPTVITLGLFLLVPMVSFSPFCFRILMGSKFSEATPVLVVLCVSIPGSIISTFYWSFFDLQGRLWRPTVIYGGVMSALNILIALILLPRIGILGSAVATSISYLVAQFLYLFDQHRYYSISLAKSGILFGAIVTFAVLQVLVGRGLLSRSVLCLFSAAALVLLARVYSLLDRGWVLRILSGKLSGLGNLLVRVIESEHKGFDHA